MIDFNFYANDHPDIVAVIPEHVLTADIDISGLSVHALTQLIHEANCALWLLQYEVTDDGDVVPRKHDR